MSAVRFEHSSHYVSATHVHEEGQAFILLHGSAVMRLDEGDWIIPTGSMGWMPPGRSHATATLKAARGISVKIPAGDCGSLPPHPTVLRPSPVTLPLLEHACDLVPGDPRLCHVLAVLRDEIAADMSTRTFVRRFSAETGMSFVQWRHRARMSQAIQRLSAGEAVTDVAFAVGYDSVSAFISRFRAMLGSTPARYLRADERA
jgi:hypothetical protein